MSLVLEISFLAIPMLAGRKTVQKGGFGPTCGFFFREKSADGLISLKVFIEFT